MLMSNRSEIQANSNQSNLENIFAPGNPDFTVNGSLNESTGRIEGLQRAKILTGQNPYQIGQDYQEAYGNIKKRTQMADTGSELLRANKAGAVADARNQMQQQGVKGGAALGAVSQVERAKSYDVNNQLMASQRQAEADYMNATKANANFTQASEMNYGAMAAGRDVKAPPVQSGGFGTVICTELFRQGYIDRKTFVKDCAYGMKISREKPFVYEGYRYLADPVVAHMEKSPSFTKAVAFFVLPWVHHIAGKRNLMGGLINVVGQFVCGIVGKLIVQERKYANQKAQ
jgi:hypothetical protein